MLLLDHFHELTATPGAAAHLRRLILDMAVRGKLVDQDPDDEPASVLLERIREERARRVAAGELKRARTQVQAVLEAQKPFDLPEGWVWCRLGQVSFNYDGDRVPLSKKQRAIRQGEYDYYGASGVIDTIDDFKYDGTYLLIGEDGANLVSRSTPLAFVASGRFWVNNHAHVLGFLEMTLLKYIEVFIEGTNLEEYITGGFQPKLSQSNLNKISIPLPPLPEQHRIVARTEALLTQLTELETAATQRKALTDCLIPALLNGLGEAVDLSTYWQKMIVPNFGLFTERPAYCDQLRRLILDLAVRGKLVAQDTDDEPASALLERIRAERARRVKAGEIRKGKALPGVDAGEVPFVLPVGWVWCRLGEITNYGIAAKIKPKAIDQKDWLLELEDIEKDTSNLKERVFAKSRSTSSDKNTFSEGDVLYGKLRPYLDKVIVADMAGVCSTEILPLTPKDKIDPSYIRIYLKSSYHLNYVDSMLSGMRMPRLRTSAGQLAYVSLPPLPEQRRIVARTESLLARVDALRAAAERRGALREGVWRALVG